MFDFQKLQVYQKAKEFSKQISELLKTGDFDRVTNDQLRRASFNIMLNIAEGASRFSNRDRKSFMVIARGSAFECVAILEFLMEMNQVSYFAANKQLLFHSSCILNTSSKFHFYPNQSHSK